MHKKTVTGLRLFKCHNRGLDGSKQKPQQLRTAVLYSTIAGKCLSLRNTPWEVVKDWTTHLVDR